MAEISLEKLHDLLEKLAEHVIIQTSTKADLKAFATKADVATLSVELHALQSDFSKFKQETNAKFSQLLEGMDAQAKRLDEMATELKAISKTLDVYNERIANLEIHNFGYRVRDKES